MEGCRFMKGKKGGGGGSFVFWNRECKDFFTPRNARKSFNKKGTVSEY